MTINGTIFQHPKFTSPIFTTPNLSQKKACRRCHERGECIHFSILQQLRLKFATHHAIYAPTYLQAAALGEGGWEFFDSGFVCDEQSLIRPSDT